MSLIQDALKRQEEDASGGPPSDGETVAAEPAPPEPAPQPPTPQPEAPPPPPPPPPAPAVPPRKIETPPPEAPPPEPATPPAVPEEPRARAWPTLVGVIAVILILGGGGVWLVFFAFQQWSRAKQPPARPAAELPGEPGRPPAAAEQPTPVADTPPREDLEPQPASGPALAEPEDRPAAVPARRGAPAQPPAPLVWPQLTLSGVVGKGANGSAIINSEVLGVDETIQDVRVVSIGKQGVMLEYKGETRFIKVGTTTQ